jgi:chitin synthase
VTSPSVDLWCLQPDNSTGAVQLVDAYQADQCYVMRMYWAWSLYLMISVPHLFVFIRCAWYLMFKKKKKPTWRTRLSVLLIETLHSIGLCMLVFLVLPSLDHALLGLMLMLGAALVPAIFKVLVRPDYEELRPLKIVFDILAIVAQVSAVILWPLLLLLTDGDAPYDTRLIWSIPVSLGLISVRWWENYVERDSRLGKVRKWCNRLAGEMRRTRTRTQLVASLWKIGLNMLLMMMFVAIQLENSGLDWVDRMTAVFNFDIRLVTITIGLLLL